MVLRPETAHTYTRCVGRIAGNAIGIVVASALMLLLHPTGLAAAVLAVVFLGLAYAASGFGYLALSAALAAADRVPHRHRRHRRGRTVSDRLLATLIGGALAVLAHVALPDHALVRLRQRAGELLKTEIDYAATVIKAFVHRLDHPAEALSAAWERAFRARAAFEAAAGATIAGPRLSTVAAVVPHRAQRGDHVVRRARDHPARPAAAGAERRLRRRGRRVRRGAVR